MNLNEILRKWHIVLPEKGICKGNSNDFELETKELLLAQKIQERVKNEENSRLAGKTMWEGVTFFHTAENMQSLAKKLGILIHSTEKFYYVRDYFFRLADGSFRTARLSRHLETAISRTHSRNLYLNATAATRTKNQFFNSWSGYTHTVSLTKDQERYFKANCIPFKYTYAEGGNVWTVTNREGQVKVLMGCDHQFHTMNTLEMENFSWGKACADLQDQIAGSLHLDAIKTGAEEMFAEGVLLCNGYSGLISRKNQLQILMMKFLLGKEILKGEENDWFSRLAVQMRAIKPFHIDAISAEKSRKIVAGYLARKAVTHALMADDFGIPQKDLHYIKQMNYHLDTFLRPGPKNSLFLLNFAFCAEILEALGNDVKLSLTDQNHLQRYIETAKKLERELGPMLKEIEKQLQDAGFYVILMPGHFLYESESMERDFPMPSGGFSMNFINSLTGWSSATKHYYYVTHGIQVGENLGNLIMEAFAAYLKSYEIEVYFIGYNPSDPTDFSEAMDWWNRMETQSGIHCVTFELTQA